MEQQEEIPEEQSQRDKRVLWVRQEGPHQAGLQIYELQESRSGSQNSNMSTLDCHHCKKNGHRESECCKKHPNKTPAWLQQKNKDSAIAGFAINGETAFMSLSDVISIETVNEDDTQYNHENAANEEDNDKNSEEGLEVEPINWDSNELISEFRKT